MTRFATQYGAFEIDSLPSQPQIAVCHAFFVREEMRGKSLGHKLKAHQADVLNELQYDYAICTCKGENIAQQKVLESAGWTHLDTFASSNTGGLIQLWGKQS